MGIRYTITAIKANGQRELELTNDTYSNYKTLAQAKTVLKNIKENNSEIKKVDCYPDGTSKQRFF